MHTDLSPEQRIYEKISVSSGLSIHHDRAGSNELMMFELCGQYKHFSVALDLITWISSEFPG